MPLMSNGQFLHLTAYQLFLDHDLAHFLMIFVFVSVAELLDDFYNQGVFPFQDEIPDPCVEVHP